MKKALTYLAITGALLGGTVACQPSSSSSGGYVDEVQYGYYDADHHYHYYSHPKTVRVTKKYYTTHVYQYTPHGTQKRVTIHKTTTTTTTHHSYTGRKTTTRRTTTHTRSYTSRR
jgi:hypothetical protein